MKLQKYFGTDGVRGKANVHPMTAEFALKLGCAAGRRFRAIGKAPHQIVIGKDTRLSCYLFEAALVAGICSQGVDAVLVGSIPTPAVAYITRSIRANAGVVISASHNPYYDNGIKFFDSTGYKLPDAVELELEDMVDNPPELSQSVIGRALRIETAVGRYVEYAKATFDKNIDLRGLKIVVDCANGAAYKVGPMALEELGADVIVINDAPNGTNINDNCGATHTEHMARTVLEKGADLGISFDGDGDRLIACDHEGNIVDGDFIMGICAKYMKQQGSLAHDTVVATVMSNEGFVQSLKKEGINTLRANVGDRYVLAEMQKGGYSLGGEQSGHLIFTEHSTTGDGLVSALQLLKMLVKSGKNLKSLASFIETYPQILLNTTVAKKVPLKELSATGSLITKIEGELKGQGRVLVRYSGTENLLRVMVEGRDAAAIDAYAKEITESAVREIGS
jgi:phosphoglucosamine mutase